MARMAGSKVLARLLLLISSVTLISLLALTRCGFGGLAESIISDDGKIITTKIISIDGSFNRIYLIVDEYLKF